MLRWVLVCWIFLTGAGSAQEFFGTFSDGPEGVFQTAVDRPKYRLTKTFVFNDPNGLAWEVPTGIEVDGASIPQIFWSFIGGPFSGNYLHASVIHDHYCRTKSRMAHDTHRNFYYGMKAKGVEGWRASAMYWAVRTFGPDWKLERRINQELRCDGDADNQICSSVPVVDDVTVTQQVDLQDPEVAAIALAKFNAIARNLKTTDGAVLDVVAAGQINGSIDSIEQSASNTRNLLVSGGYRDRPSDLGMLVYSPAALDQTTVWQGNLLPKYDTLRTFDASAGKEELPFKLGTGDIDELQMKLDLHPYKVEMRPK